MSAHSRLFSPETLYAEGAAPVPGVDPPARVFPFERDEDGSTPRDPFAFFDWLFADARERWGMRMYEQDWTSTIYRWSSPKCTPLQRLMKVFAYVFQVQWHTAEQRVGGSGLDGGDGSGRREERRGRGPRQSLEWRCPPDGGGGRRALGILLAQPLHRCGCRSQLAYIKASVLGRFLR